MNILTFDAYYKRFGVKTPMHLMTPVMPTIDKFSFPKNSIYHFAVHDTVNNGPTNDEYYFRDISKRICIDHILELTDSKGFPKKLTIPLMPYIRDYHLKHKRYRNTPEVASIQDENTLVVVNYGFISNIYRYVRNPYSEYYKWWNMEKTLWDTAKKLAQTTGRHQFMLVNLPAVLPSINRLQVSMNNFSLTVLKLFNTNESLFILELWKWLSVEHRSTSVIGDADINTLNKLNLVFIDSGRFILVNLGTIDNWRYDPSNPKDGQKIKLDVEQLHKRFLRMLMSLSQAKIEANKDTKEEDTVEFNDPSITLDTGAIVTPALPVETKIVELTEAELNNDNVKDELSTHEQHVQMLQSLDEDLEYLDLLNKKKEEELESDVEVKDTKFTDKDISAHTFHTDDTVEDSINNLCDNLANNGALTASEYRKFKKLSNNYKSLVAPNTDVPLHEFINIPREDLVIQESKSMPDIPTVLDKTMLKSSLMDFNERYITDILQKDISGMIVNSQKAGFVINSYEVEKDSSILGSYETHTLRITPVEGVASTIRFKLPVLDEEGTYSSSSVKYRLRYQRGDLPIRKTKPDIVALTSYYGKVFISRNDKKVNDYGYWLKEQITQMAIDRDNGIVSNVVIEDVFDNYAKVPRVYSSIAKGIRSFTAKGYNFTFDYKTRDKVFTEEQIKKYETDGSVLVGFNSSDNVLLMDKNNHLQEVTTDGLIPFGTIESVVGLDPLSAPTDYTQVKIYGKNIPIVAVLGYKYGLNTLIEKLKADVRRVPAGQRLNLQEHEYPVQFSDETLVFSKDDRLATLVFAGFREYNKVLKHYKSNVLNKPNVYLNLLESTGLSTRYLREIDLLDTLFVDPITKDLLIEMDEPLTFRGLLIRATEMLMTDDHPDALDMEYMRIKGYERFAGAIYNELIAAIRNHKAKSGRKNAAIEMNPYAVWKRIADDPSLSIVSEINPVEDLKQKESVTYGGVGGRSSRSMSKSTRAYHKNDMGVISEATSDSSDVGVNTYTSADPQFKSLRGTTKRYEIGKTGATALLSTSALMAVGSEFDD